MKTFISEKHQNEAIASLKTILSYPSYLQEDDETPFGKDIQAVLEKTLEITEGLGFRTYIDPDGYYGYAEIGEGEELFAVLCHLDVVPPGNLTLWDSKPFEPIIKDGYIIARGTEDDKGPTMAALYAVKALLDAGETLNKRVRFIFGVDEENLWRCLGRYNEKEEKAILGIDTKYKYIIELAMKEFSQIDAETNPDGWHSAKINLESFILQANLEKEYIHEKANKREFKLIQNDPALILEDAKIRIINYIQSCQSEISSQRRYLEAPKITDEAIYKQLVKELKLHRHALKNIPDKLNVLDNFIEMAVNRKEQFKKQDEDISNDDNLIVINKTAFPSKYIFQLDPVSTGIFENPISANNVTNPKELTDIININYEDITGVEIDGIRDFSGYDGEVLNAIISLYVEAGNEYITPKMINQVIAANPLTKTSKEQEKVISEAVTKFMFTKLIIKSFNAAKKYGLDSMAYEGNLLYAEKVKGVCKGNVMEWIHILKTPVLYEYASSTNQIGRVNIKILNTRVNKTTENVILQQFLMKNIIKMRNYKGNLTESKRKINFSDIFNILKLNDTHLNAISKKRVTARAVANKILSDWKDMGFIESYEICKSKKNQKVYSHILINLKEYTIDAD